jgi:hypothetical protein
MFELAPVVAHTHTGVWQGCQMVCFQTKNSKFGKILEGLEMEDIGIFYEHLGHFTFFCYILLTFGIVCGNWEYFFPFWYFVPRKIWQP